MTRPVHGVRCNHCGQYYTSSDAIEFLCGTCRRYGHVSAGFNRRCAICDDGQHEVCIYCGEPDRMHKSSCIMKGYHGRR